MPDDWTTQEIVQTLKPSRNIQLSCPGAKSVSLDSNKDLALFGGSDGSALVFSISQDKLVQKLDVGSPITDTLWAGSKAVVGTSTGTIKLFENGVEESSFSGHAGEVTALALHPSGEILASVGIDKNYVFYDLKSARRALQVSTDSGEMKYLLLCFQPQLLIFASTHHCPISPGRPSFRGWGRRWPDQGV